MDRRAPILLVDDDATLLKLYSKLLGRFNEPVIAVNKGLDALKMIWEQTPALMLFDVVMPEMDGFELCAQVRKAVPHPVPIVFMTADDTIRTAELGLTAGGDDFMVKGIAVTDYLWRVNFWLKTPLPGLTRSQRAKAVLRARELAGHMKPTDPIISNEFRIDDTVQTDLIELVRRAWSHAGPDFGRSKQQQHIFLGYLLGVADECFGDSLALMARAPAYVQAAIDVVGLSPVDARDFFNKLPLIEYQDGHQRAFVAGQTDARLYREQGSNALLKGLVQAG